LALGLLLGYSLQRGGYCMNTAFRSFFLEKDKGLVRAWVLVLLINVAGVRLLTDLGVLQPAVAPLFWPAAVVGGFVFGAGMVLAGGCASGTYYRCGRGMLGSIAALIGFAVGATITDGGALTPLQSSLRAATVDVGSSSATVFGVLGVESAALRWIVLGAAAVPAVIWLLRAPPDRFRIGWSRHKSGAAIGVLALLTWLLSAMQGRDFGLSFTQPTVAVARFLVTGDTTGISVASFIVIAVPVGAFLAAKAAGEAVLRAPDPKRLVRQAGGGLTMGVGASVAGGCNIGHSVTGVSTLGITAIIATVFIILGCWAMTRIIVATESRQMNRSLHAAVE
ncbi:MAG: YeeE/YedE family protein, partial [Spirochaetaceae bacterium]